MYFLTRVQRVPLTFISSCDSNQQLKFQQAAFYVQPDQKQKQQLRKIKTIQVSAKDPFPPLVLVLCYNVPLGWLGAGNNDFGEGFLLFQVFLSRFFRHLRHFFDAFSARAQRGLKIVEKVSRHEEKKKSRPKSLLPNPTNLVVHR